MNDKTRFYGRDGTIHRTEQLNIELDPDNGEVVAVWFRCQPLPFTQTTTTEERALEMRGMYEHGPMPAIVGVTLKDKLGEIG